MFRFRLSPIEMMFHRVARTAVSSRVTTTVTMPAVCAIRHIHEALPPVRRSRAANQATRQENAKMALLHLNVMIDQGMEPDVLMYTNLIAIMGAAKLEWQAYKLFSRMLGQGLRPLPETYLALQRATNPARAQVIADLERRIHETSLALPGQVAQVEKGRRDAEDREAQRAFDALLGEAADAPDPFRITSASSSPSPTAADNTTSKTYRFGDDGPIPSIDITSPRGVMAALDAMKGQARSEVIAAENAKRAVELTAKLAKLHEEELRIFLTIHRQLRDGTKEDMINRVLSVVPGEKIDEMLSRRKRYFRAVGDVLELQVRELREAGSGGDVADGAPSDDWGPDAAAEENRDNSENNQLNGDVKPHEREANAVVRSIQHEAAGDLAPAASANDDVDILSHSDLVPNADKTQMVTSADRFSAAPEAIRTPWGVIQKPVTAGIKMTEKQAPNPERDDAMALSDEEIAQVYISARTGAINEVPLHLLRRYCRQYRLSWKRSAGPDAIAAQVSWHAETFPPSSVLERVGGEAYNLFSSGTRESGDVIEQRRRAREYEIERRGAAETQERFDALRIIAKRCGNVRLVDSADISKAISRFRRKNAMAARQAKEEAQRLDAMAKRRALDDALTEMPAAFMAEQHMKNKQDASASTATLASTKALITKAKTERILGLESASTATGTARTWSKAMTTEPVASPATEDEAEEESAKATELPPWAVRTGSSRFNFATGRFGDPTRAQIKERADGTFGLGFGDQRGRSFKVDVEALPADDRQEIKTKLLREELSADSPEAAAWRRRAKEVSTNPKGKRALAFAQRAKYLRAAAKAQAREENGTPAQSFRMAQVLKEGKDTVKAVRRVDANLGNRDGDGKNL
jgi:hypothetical protein